MANPTDWSFGRMKVLTGWPPPRPQCSAAWPWQCWLARGAVSSSALLAPLSISFGGKAKGCHGMQEIMARHAQVQNQLRLQLGPGKADRADRLVDHLPRLHPPLVARITFMYFAICKGFTNNVQRFDCLGSSSRRWRASCSSSGPGSLPICGGNP